MIDTNWLVKTNINIDGFTDTINDITKDETPDNIFNKSTRGNKSVQFDLINHFKKIQYITNKITKEFESIEVLQKKKFKPLMGWTVYGHQGGYHKVHNHVGQHGKLDHISVVLYLETPNSKGWQQRGQFYFFLLDENGIKYHEIEPEKGMMIIMPTKVMHGSYPQPRGLRHTLNFDFGVA